MAALLAWEELGEVPEGPHARLTRRFEEEPLDEAFAYRVAELEAVTRHDIVAFTRALSERYGDDTRHIHRGLTSTDVVDSAQNLLLLQAMDLILRDVEALTATVRELATQHRHLPVIGRTHGIHAEPTTFGLKLALWYEEMKRNLERFDQAAKGIAYGKISGAVGTYANIDPFVEKYVCDNLGLKPAPISTQTLQRDRHAHYMATLALIATSIEKMAVEIRGLQKSETREVEEFFASGQKGSSAMPHKRNPIGSENMTGMARVVRGYMLTAYENVPLWHERDISHSSAERIIIPDATIAIDYMLHRFGNIVENLVVFEEKMKKNIYRTYGLVFSQQVLLSLIDHGLTREEAYDLVQPLAMQAWEEEVSFPELVKSNEKINELLSKDDIEACFDPTYHLKNVDQIFERLGL